MMGNETQAQIKPKDVDSPSNPKRASHNQEHKESGSRSVEELLGQSKKEFAEWKNLSNSLQKSYGLNTSEIAETKPLLNLEDKLPPPPAADFHSSKGFSTLDESSECTDSNEVGMSAPEFPERNEGTSEEQSTPKKLVGGAVSPTAREGGQEYLDQSSPTDMEVDFSTCATSMSDEIPDLESILKVLRSAPSSSISFPKDFAGFSQNDGYFGHYKNKWKVEEDLVEVASVNVDNTLSSIDDVFEEMLNNVESKEPKVSVDGEKNDDLIVFSKLLEKHEPEQNQRVRGEEIIMQDLETNDVEMVSSGDPNEKSSTSTEHSNETYRARSRMAYTKQFLLSRQNVESALIKPPDLSLLYCVVDSPGASSPLISKLVGKENRRDDAREQSYSQEIRRQDYSSLAARDDRDRAASSHESSVSLGKEVEPMLKGEPTLNDELATFYSEMYIDNYILKRNDAAMMRHVSEMFHDATIHKFVFNCVTYLLKQTSTDRMLGGVILHLLMVNSYLTPKQLENGFEKIMEIVEDLITDIPNLFEYVGEILEPLFSSNQISFAFLRELEKSCKKSEYRTKLLAGVMKILCGKLGWKRISELWAESGLTMDEFQKGQDQKNFIGDDETPSLYHEGVHLSSSETGQVIPSTKTIEHTRLYSYFDEEELQKLFGTPEKKMVENPTKGHGKEVVGSERSTDEEARVFPLPENCNFDLDLSINNKGKIGESSIQLIPRSNIDAVLKLSHTKLSMDEKTVAPTVQDNLLMGALSNEKEDGREEIIDVFSDGSLETDGKLFSIQNSEINKEPVVSTCQDILSYKYANSDKEGIPSNRFMPSEKRAEKDGEMSDTQRVKSLAKERENWTDSDALDCLKMEKGVDSKINSQYIENKHLDNIETTTSYSPIGDSCVEKFQNSKIGSDDDTVVYSTQGVVGCEWKETVVPKAEGGVDVGLVSSRKRWDDIKRDIPSTSGPLDIKWGFLTDEKSYVDKEEYPSSRQSFESPRNRFVERPVSSCKRSESGELKPPGFDNGSSDLFTSHSLALTAIFDQLKTYEKLLYIQNKELQQHKAKINQLSQENEVFKDLFLSIGKQTKENQDNVSVIKDMLQKSEPFFKRILVPEYNINRKDISPSERSLDGNYSQKMVDNSERFRNIESSFSTDKPFFNNSQHIGDYSSSATDLRSNRIVENPSASTDSLFNRSTESFSEAAGTSFIKSNNGRTTEGRASSEDKTRLPLSKGVVENVAAARLNTVRKSINWQVKFSKDMLQQIDAGYMAPYLESPVHCFPDIVGYSMVLEVYPSGYGRGRGSHLSLYWRLVNGENDDKLTWPFTGTVTFVLRPVDSNDRSVASSTRVCSKMAPFQKPRVPANEADVMDGWGIPRFVRHDIALRPTYLSKGELTITVHVDVDESAFARV